MTVPSATLPSGDELPRVGVGTWDIEGDTGRESVRAALDADYRHVDTAAGCANESEIGEVIANHDRDRDHDDLFLPSKVLPSNLTSESVSQACEDSFDRLGTDYLDLYLIHWPNPAVSLRETLRGVERLHERGVVRNVGVSDFSAHQLGCAHSVSDVPIAVNQIEYHPRLQRPDLVEYCRESDTVIAAAAPLARTEIFEEDAVADPTGEYDRTPAQVVLRWTVENDVVVLPKSPSSDHVCENRDVFDWELDDLTRPTGTNRCTTSPHATGPATCTASRSSPVRPSPNGAAARSGSHPVDTRRWSAPVDPPTPLSAEVRT